MFELELVRELRGELHGQSRAAHEAGLLLFLFFEAHVLHYVERLLLDEASSFLLRSVRTYRLR